jgi:hypothetical protein
LQVELRGDKVLYLDTVNDSTVTREIGNETWDPHVDPVSLLMKKIYTLASTVWFKLIGIFIRDVPKVSALRNTSFATNRPSHLIIMFRFIPSDGHGKVILLWQNEHVLLVAIDRGVGGQLGQLLG